MMKGKYIILTLAAIACISCNKEDRGRRDDGRDPSREPVPESSFVENPAWTITYTGREALLSDELTYVVDALHVKSTDSGSWFLDVVSANDYLTEYNNKLESFISASVKAAKEGGYLEVENADADIVFDILDEGGCNWIAIAYGCDDKGNLTGLDDQIKTLKESSPYLFAEDGGGQSAGRARERRGAERELHHPAGL